MIHAPRLVFLAAALFLAPLAGCGKPQAPPPAEDPAERVKAARDLLRRAQVAPIPEKFDAYRRVIALYDDTEVGGDAAFELVISLVRDATPHVGDALAIARVFAQRRPTDARVGEAFLQVADAAYWTKDVASRAAALAAWARHLEARDVAGDVPKAALYADFVRLRLREERWQDAEVAIDTALAEPDLPKFERVEILVRKGSLLSEKLGNPAAGRAAFEEALRLSRELHAGGTGRLGIPPAQIEEEIAKLSTSSRPGG